MVKLLEKAPSRHPFVASRRTPLTDEQWDLQIQRDLFTTERGEKFALPIDHVKRPNDFMHQDLWRMDETHGVYRPGTKFHPLHFSMQRKALTWARDHINQEIPYWYYMLTLGHDVHISTSANLYGHHWHNGWANPFTGETEGPIDPTFEALMKTHYVDHVCDLFNADGGSMCPRYLGITLQMLQGLRGFQENLGLLSSAKVTTAFRAFEIAELVAATEYQDVDFHEVGTDATADLNSNTALLATSGITRVDGSPTDADPIYRNVATITADTTETWEEHGLFSNSSGPTLADRNVTGGQSVNSSDQVQYTYEMTKNAEA